jgi:hypothetical protein
MATRGFRQVSKSYNDSVGYLADVALKGSPANSSKATNVFVCENFRKDNFSLLWNMQGVPERKGPQDPVTTPMDPTSESQLTVDAVHSVVSSSRLPAPRNREVPIEIGGHSSQKNSTNNKTVRKRRRAQAHSSALPETNAEAQVSIRAEGELKRNRSQDHNHANLRVTNKRSTSESGSYLSRLGARAERSIAQSQPENGSLIRPVHDEVATECTPNSANVPDTSGQTGCHAIGANGVSEVNLDASVSKLLAGSVLSYSTAGAAPGLASLSNVSQTNHILRVQQMQRLPMDAPVPLLAMSPYLSLTQSSPFSPLPSLGFIDPFVRDLPIRHPSSLVLLPHTTVCQQPQPPLSPPTLPRRYPDTQQEQIELLQENNALLQRLLSRLQDVPQNQGASPNRQTE